MRRFSVFALVVVLAAIAFPKTARTEGDAGLVAMRAIGFLEGSWQGEGWARQGPGEPQPFRSTEVVESRLDGRVLIVEGRHFGLETGEVVHHALATISYDSTTGRYSFRSHLASGRSGDFEADLIDGQFIWSMEIPSRGRIRYTIQIEDDRWHEVGEFSADGEQWHQTFQMDLVKVAD